jgi:phage replication O-like protein O
MTAQLENGYTRIANEIIEELLLQKLTAYEMKFILLVIRKTYGWGLLNNKISLSYISEKTGIDLRNVSRIKKSLLKRGILTKSGHHLGFNKRFNQWQDPSPPPDPSQTTGATPSPEPEATPSEQPDNKEIVKESLKIVEFLNKTVGTRFSPKNKQTQRLIKARLKDGFTLDDFYLVISGKSLQWKKDKKMKKFLRPETLFGNKFEGYLQEGRHPSESGIASWARKHLSEPRERPLKPLILEIGGMSA